MHARALLCGSLKRFAALSPRESATALSDSFTQPSSCAHVRARAGRRAHRSSATVVGTAPWSLTAVARKASAACASRPHGSSASSSAAACSSSRHRASCSLQAGGLGLGSHLSPGTAPAAACRQGDCRQWVHFRVQAPRQLPPAGTNPGFSTWLHETDCTQTQCVSPRNFSKTTTWHPAGSQ